MPSTFDPLLRLELQATGENENTWGEKANNNFELLGESIAGHVSVAVTGSGDLSLSASNGVTDQARRAFITLSGTLTGTRNIIIPSASKTYFFRRNTSGSHAINIKTASGAAAELPATGVAVVVCDGVDCWLLEDATKFPSAGGGITGFVEISVSTSTSGPAALTITQIGPGPAFVVEDAVNDTSPFVVRADGTVVVGTSTAYNIDAANAAAFQVHRNNGSAALLAGTWSASNLFPQIQLIRSRGGAVGTRAAVSVGDNLGRLVFSGDDGTIFEPSAAILATVAATVSASIVPGQLLFQTANDAGTLATRMTVNQEGNVGVGTTAPTEALHLVGNLRIGNAVMASPTGSPPLFAARAWCVHNPFTPNFFGGNIASVTQNGVGDYTYTFTTAMPNVNYAPLIVPSGATGANYVVARLEGSLTTTSFRIQCVGSGVANTDFEVDPFQIFIAVFA